MTYAPPGAAAAPPLDVASLTSALPAGGRVGGSVLSCVSGLFQGVARFFSIPFCSAVFFSKTIDLELLTCMSIHPGGTPTQVTLLKFPEGAK